MPDELTRLYDQHADALCAFLLNVTRDDGDTRDILQDVFVKLARRPALLEGARDERAFLLRLAHNAARDLFRRRTVRAQNEGRFAGEVPLVFEAAESVGEQAHRAALNAALAELPEEQRAVVHLKLWEELTFEDIAEVLGISANTAASRYRYGLDKLRARLRPLQQELQ